MKNIRVQLRLKDDIHRGDVVRPFYGWLSKNSNASFNNIDNTPSNKKFPMHIFYSMSIQSNHIQEFSLDKIMPSLTSKTE